MSSRGTRSRLLQLASVWLAALLGAAPAARSQSVSAEDVDQSIREATGVLLHSLNHGNVGADALTVLALLHAGVPANHPQLESAIRRIVAGASSIEQGYVGTYYSGIVNMMLSEVRNPDYAITAGMIARNLLSMQHQNGSWGDNSRTQFALLGLKAAKDLGVSIPKEAFEKAQCFIEAGQSNSGG